MILVPRKYLIRRSENEETQLTDQQVAHISIPGMPPLNCSQYMATLFQFLLPVYSWSLYGTRVGYSSEMASRLVRRIVRVVHGLIDGLRLSREIFSLSPLQTGSLSRSVFQNMSTTSLAQPRTYYKMSSIDQQKKLIKRICQKYQNSPWPSLAQLQKATSLDTPAPARGGVWIARTSFSAPTNPAIRDVLYTVVHRLKKEYHRISPVEETSVIDVGVEFIGPLSQVPDDAPEPDIPEEEKLRALLQECNSELTILYAHGGGL